MTGWTEEQDARLKELHARGLSRSWIGAEIGKTRNAVCGRLHRLGIGLTPEEQKERKSGLNSYAREWRQQRDPNMKPARPRRLRPRHPADAPEPDTGFRCTIIGLDSRRCRWPIGDPQREDFRYCGFKTDAEGGPYCPYHAAIAYRGFSKRIAA